MNIRSGRTGAEVVGWLQADKGSEAYHALGWLGLQQEHGVFVVREHDHGLAWLIDDDGWNEDLPVDVRFTKRGLIFDNRDYDKDRLAGRPWAQPDCGQSTVDLPRTYQFDQAARAGGQLFFLVFAGLHRASQNRNLNPGASVPLDHRVRMVEVMYFNGPPPENAASLYFEQ